MNPFIGVVLLASLALFCALACVAVLYVMGRPGPRDEDAAPRERRVAQGERSSEPPPANAAPVVPDARPARGSRRLRPAKGVQQCLFVVLDRPGEETNRGLAGLLAGAGARYNAKLGIYHVVAPRGGYRLTIANASPPGTLPPLHEGGEQPIVSGVSILINFVNKRRVARSPDTLIDFTQAVADLGGKVLDAERRLIPPEAFERLREDTR
ncbi:cell division protein ZipA C-terminal FtsZ-binding domain-containing protein [Halomonas kalidii]|uniref:Cell division protein ZipA n=1 Tax=Halomonas kalidii TaxID=3043293 RepID=A0ABT6VPQ8_9GAMM|nr:cell division protein ZipA C-terminal FtsZ-binding domain-containing protein [Halomonas kalidii]MDI5935982.1 cell division protein ZipA C-terminal FtsZ-binding domain-containing protein [Halomonas kalidii]